MKFMIQASITSNINNFSRKNYSSTNEKVCLITFRKCIFDFYIDLKEFARTVEKVQRLSNKPYDLSFFECVFNGKVISKKATFNCSFEFTRVVFSNEVSLTYSYFNYQVTISSTRFDEMLYCDCSKFLYSFKISLCDIKGGIQIIRCEVKETINLDCLEVNKGLYFQTTSCKTLEIIRSSIGQCTLINSKINFFCNFSSCKFKLLTIENLFLGEIALAEHNLHIKTMTRETARFLKHEALKIDNSILALRYQVEEMDIYRKETFKKRKLGTWLLLLLNKISNNYGSCWELGVVFTVFFWFIFYSLFVILRDGWGNHFIWADPVYIKQSISYFWLFDGMDELTKSDTVNWWMTIVFVLGKIFIAYGIYQTVSAFRKYGKS